MVTRVLTLLCVVQLCFSQTHTTPMAFVPPTTTAGADSQLNFAGTAADQGDGDYAWTDPNNALGVCAAPYAVFGPDAPSGSTSGTIFLTNYGFSIPGGSTIDGIEIIVYISDASSTDPCLEIHAYLINEGSQIGTDAATNASIVTKTTYGGATDTWGATLTPTVVNSSSFGFAYQIVSNDGNDAGNASLGCVSIKVHYH